MDEQTKAPTAPTPTAPTKSRVPAFVQELWNGEMFPVVKHTTYMCTTILGIYVFEHVYAHLLGENAMLFDHIPYKYVGDLGDTIALIRYFKKMWEGFK